MLIEEGARECTSFTLMQRHQQELNSDAVELLQELKPRIRSEREVAEWPGTKLFGGTATLREYELTEATGEVLLRAAGGLYDWCQPNLPEDLILWRADAEPWLVSIAHEQDGYLWASPTELEELLERLPPLRRLVASTSQRG